MARTVPLSFWPKNVQNWSKICIFGHFGPNIAFFCPFRPMTDQKPMQTRCLGGFSVMWVTKLLISPVKIRIFCPKMTKFGPKLAFLVILGQVFPAHLVPWWWVGWWLRRAGCISQDFIIKYTYSYIHIYVQIIHFEFVLKPSKYFCMYIWQVCFWHRVNPTIRKYWVVYKCNNMV